MERIVEDSKLLTVEQVAELLAVTPAWVYMHQRELPVVRLGDGPKAAIRVSREDLGQWLRDRKS
jgi:excisionase family DNA binding protein